MTKASDAVVWVNKQTKQVMMRTQRRGVPEDRPEYAGAGHWGDPIGAAYSEWLTMTDQQRVHLMLVTVIDLCMQGFAMKDVLVAFADVREFRALGGESFPMCRALTAALIGKCLEPNTMSFEELLECERARAAFAE